MIDPISDRRFELEQMQNIPDIFEYAKSWELLAQECDKQDRPSTAEMCRSKAKHYCGLAGGEYVRLVQDTFVELIYAGIPAER